MTAAQSGPANGVVVTSTAIANTKGLWSELIASTSSDSTWVYVQIQGNGGTVDDDFLVDIGVGAVLSEVVVIPDLLFTPGSGMTRYKYAFPLEITSGSRISARCQDNGGSGGGSIRVQITVGFDPSVFNTGTSIEAVGTNAGDSGGVDQANYGLGSFGSWTEITTSGGIVDDFIGFCVSFGKQGDVIVSSERSVAYQIGTGAPSSEVVLIDNLLFSSRGHTDDFAPGVSPYLPIPLVSATRLHARLMVGSTGSGGQPTDAVIYGLVA